MGQQLANQVMLVTGAGSKIGRQSATLLAQSGAKIVAADLKSDALTRTVTTLKAAGYDAIAVPTNTLVANDVNYLVTTAKQHFGRLDGLITHAGLPDHLIAPETFGDKLWDQVTAINTASVRLITQAVTPLFSDQQHGIIVIVATVGPVTDDQAQTAYTATKRAVTTLTKRLAHQTAKQGLRVNAITPGDIQADIVEPLRVHEAQVAGDLKVVTKTSDAVAQAVLFLASERSHDVNGMVMAVDRGWTH